MEEHDLKMKQIKTQDDTLKFSDSAINTGRAAESESMDMLKLTKLTETDDTEAFLITFEQLMLS